jgi:hypothetical protein
VIGAVGVEMLNKRGLCALHLKVIAVAAGVSVGTAREAIMIAETSASLLSSTSGASMTYAVVRPTGCRRFVSFEGLELAATDGRFRPTADLNRK